MKNETLSGSKFLLGVLVVAFNLIMATQSLAGVAQAQGASSSPAWAVVGNSFTWSVSENLVSPGSTATTTSGAVTLTVQSVVGSSVSLLESTTGESPTTVSADLNSPIPPNGNGFYLYIPPSQLQTTLGGVYTSLVSNSGFLAPGIAPSPTVALKTVSTSLGDVTAWTMEASGSGNTTSAGSLFSGQESISFSYDSQLGLLLAAHLGETGTVTGTQSGSMSLSLDVNLIQIPSSVSLTPGQGSAISLPILLIILVVVVVVIVVVAAVFLSMRREAPVQNPIPAQPSAAP